jgi:ureidoacrylate peracid hydrolase
MAQTLRSGARTGTDYLRIRAERTALFVIDMQNAFIAPGAALEVPGGRDLIPRIAALVETCRRRSVPIVWMQLDASPPGGGLLLEKYPRMREHAILFRGTPGFDLHWELPAPRDDEVRIVKHKYDSFHGTDLDEQLRGRGIESVIICGVTTNCCCESTARSAFERDYRVAFVADATAAFTDALHRNTLAAIDELFGRVVSTAEVLTELGASRAA